MAARHEKENLSIETPSSEYFDKALEEIKESISCGRQRRLDDEMRLRELELQTSFQIKTLSESLNYLKEDFHSWRDSMNTNLTDMKAQVDKLKMQGTIVIALLISQLAGAPKFIAQLFTQTGLM